MALVPSTVCVYRKLIPPSSAGQDATEAFEDVGHSDEARALLPEMLVGDFEGSVCTHPFCHFTNIIPTRGQDSQLKSGAAAAQASRVSGAVEQGSKYVRFVFRRSLHLTSSPQSDVLCAPCCPWCLLWMEILHRVCINIHPCFMYFVLVLQSNALLRYPYIPPTRPVPISDKHIHLCNIYLPPAGVYKTLVYLQ